MDDLFFVAPVILKIEIILKYQNKLKTTVFNYNREDPIWKILTILDKFNPIWTSLIQFEQIWTILDKFNLIWTILNRFDLIWTSLINFGQVSSNLDRIDPI